MHNVNSTKAAQEGKDLVIIVFFFFRFGNQHSKMGKVRHFHAYVQTNRTEKSQCAQNHLQPTVTLQRQKNKKQEIMNKSILPIIQLIFQIIQFIIEHYDQRTTEPQSTEHQE